MKNNFRKLLVIVCMFTCILGLTACGNAKESQEGQVPEILGPVLDGTVKSMLEDFDKKSDEQLDKYIEDNDIEDSVYIAAVENWKSTREEVGALKSVEKIDTSFSGENITVEFEVQYELRKAECIANFTDDGELVSFTINPEYTFAEKMQKAGMNTLIGMGVVFAVLIGIAAIISLMKYVNVLGEGGKQSKETIGKQAVDNTIAQIVQKEVAEVAPQDDLELIAVITAAIAAYEGTTQEGLVVRSIRKVDRKWRRA